MTPRRATAALNGRHVDGSSQRCVPSAPAGTPRTAAHPCVDAFVRLHTCRTAATDGGPSEATTQHGSGKTVATRLREVAVAAVNFDLPQSGVGAEGGEVEQDGVELGCAEFHTQTQPHIRRGVNHELVVGLQTPTAAPLPGSGRRGRHHMSHPRFYAPRTEPRRMTLQLVPLRNWRDATGFVGMWHRHHKPPIGYLWAHGVATEDGVLVGVAIVGRPVAGAFDDGRTVEVTRTATDGHPNANSMLYGAVARAAFAKGYRRVVTYTQDGESGASLRAAGYRVVAQRPPRRGWDTPSRPRTGNGNDGVARTLWEAAS